MPASVPGIVGPSAGLPLRLRTLIPTIPLPAGGSVEYALETSFTGAAGVVLHGNTKPTTSITFTKSTATISTIATVLKVALQSLSDTPGLQEWLDRRLRRAVEAKEEHFLLFGESGQSIFGLMNMAPAYTPPAGAASLLDVVGNAIGDLQARGYVVDGVVLNAANFTASRLTKDTTGAYLWSDPAAAMWGTPALWNVPVILSPSLSPGTYLVGAFGQSAVIFDRMALRLDIAYENEDDFIRNLACLRAELREALAVPVPAGLLQGTVAATLAAEQTTPEANAKAKR